MDIKQPKKFVGLHAHSTLSIGDSTGLPQEHIDYVIKNGADALALTDHGNMNGFSHQYLHAKKLKEKGINFKPIFGIESYYVESLENWRNLKEKLAAEKLEEKIASKSKTKKEELEEIGDEHASTREEMREIAKQKKETDEEQAGGTLVENEDESKGKVKSKNPLAKRNHLVLLAKNSEGLKSIFKLVSRSFIEGFYLYPRIDLTMLKEEAKGNIVALQACSAGNLAKTVFDHQIERNFELWKPNDDNMEIIQRELKDKIDGFKDALGEENYYLELQFHALPFQHLANYHFIEASKRTNTPLVVTCDSHYANPDHWREREIYKLMAWMSKSKGEVSMDKIPKTADELKCELYPKNAEQLWEAYHKYGKANYSFYDDQMVADAIERTWNIAHEQIGFPEPDHKVKLPSIQKLVPQTHLLDFIDKLGEIEGKDEDALAFEELKRLAKEGIKRRGKQEEKEYIDRLVYELKVVKELKFSKYFITYAKIMEIVGKNMITGAGRGSASGSLLAYCLNITQIDPIKYNLLFQRFLVVHKKGYPDIDSDVGNRDKAIDILSEYFGEENVVSVSNFNQLQLRSLIKDVAKLSGVPFEEINKYTGKIEIEAMDEAKKAPGFDRAQWVLTYDEAEKNSPTFRQLLKTYPDFEKTIKILFKQMRNISRHAGGVCITNNSPEAMPMIKSGGVYQTPWPEGLNARHLEDFGLLKFDILGLGTLRMFEECIKKIIQKQTKKKIVSFEEINDWYYKNLHPDNNVMDDQYVYKHIYWEQRFAGIFQFIAKNVQKFTSEIKPTSINDLAAITSTFRPGPLAIGNDKIFLKNKKNPENIIYQHPLLKDILKDTSGCLSGDTEIQFIDGTKEYIKNIVENKSFDREIISYNENDKKLEPDKIVAARQTGIKNIYKITTENGIEIEATEDHLFYTKSGVWKKVSDLTVEDEVMIYE